MSEQETTGFMSAEELAAVQHLHTRAPYAITGISRGMFSVARHYGGMKFQGASYTYVPEHDECVRDDVLRSVLKMRKKAAPRKESTAAVAPDLFEETQG